MYIHAMVEGRNTYSGAGSIRVHGTAGSLKGKASHDDGYVPCKGVWHDFGREFSCSVGLFDPGATRAQSRSRHSIITCRIALTHILHMGARIGIMRMYVAVNGSC